MLSNCTKSRCVVLQRVAVPAISQSYNNVASLSWSHKQRYYTNLSYNSHYKLHNLRNELSSLTYNNNNNTPLLYTISSRRFSSYPDHTILKMPALSPTMEKGNLATWVKKEGDSISAGEVMAEVETDKATVAFEAVEDGYLAKILIPGGSNDIEVGRPVAVVVEEKDDIDKFKDFTLDEGKQDTSDAAAAGVKRIDEKQGDKAEQAKQKQDEKPKQSQQSQQQPQQQQSSDERVKASPYAQKLATEQGIDLHKIKGTGPNNRIVAADINEQSNLATQQASQQDTQLQQATEAQQPTSEGSYNDIRNSQMRKVIAKRLLESKQLVPHYYVTQEIQVDKLLQLRNELNATLALKNPTKPLKLSVNDMIVKAAALALKAVPEVNATWTNDYIRQYNYTDIAVAVATPSGLITPIIRNADTIGLSRISEQTKELARLAKDNKLQPQQYQGGTFTISNLGMYGVTHFTAIINSPHSAILAVGTTQERVVVDKSISSNLVNSSESKFKVANVLTVTMSADHRVIDGAKTAEWLQAFKGYMENPQTMLL